MQKIHNETVWTKEHYKMALKMTQTIPKRELSLWDSLLNERIEALPFKNLQQYFEMIKNKEFRVIPYRVYGLAQNQAEHLMASRNDIGNHSFTIFSKHAFATMFIFEMSDTRIQKEPFVQMMIERIYSNKKGYGSKLIQHIVKKATQCNVTLSIWSENETLRDYFVSHGFTFKYKSLTTGHYFLMYK